jgi:uncharacterized protein YciI
MIQTTPDPQKAHLREQLVKAHGSYLEQHQAIVLAAGVLMEEDGKNAGGLLIVDVDEREAAERFVRDDPFAPLFASVIIKRWRKGFFNFKRAT